MKKTLSEYEFVNEFQAVQNRRDSQNFTREGLFALYDFFEEYEESTDEEIEFDPIAICCEYTEYATATEAASEYSAFEGMTFGEDGEELETVEEVEQKALKFLEENTSVLQFDGGVIIQKF